jgi:hypothetical protein
MRIVTRVLIFICVLLPNLASASIILDQSVTRDNFNSGAGGGPGIAQTVTVGVSGYLDSINVFGFATPSNQVVFRLHAVDSNQAPLFNSVLATILFDANSLTTADTPHVLDLSSYSLQYSAGDMFAFSIYTPTSRLNWYFNQDQAGYNGGKGYINLSFDQSGVPNGFVDASTFLNRSNLDWQFETFMSSNIQVDVNEPSTIALFVTSLILMIRFRRNYCNKSS